MLDIDESVNRNEDLMEGVPFGLTDIQQAYLIARSGMSGSGSKSTQLYVEIKFTDLDIEQFHFAWNTLVKRHRTLRTAFDETSVTQKVLPFVADYFAEILDVSDDPEPVKQSKILAMRHARERAILPAKTGPLYDIVIVKLDERNYRVNFCIDLIITDISSLIIIFEEFGAAYNGDVDFLAPIGVEFSAYITALAKLKDTPAYLQAKEYWGNRVKNFPSAPKLPYLSQPPGTAIEFKRREFHLDELSWSRLKANAKRSGCSPTILIATVFSQVLGEWSEKKDFGLNFTLLNRVPLGNASENLVGDFTSNIILHAQGSRSIPFIEKLKMNQAQFSQDIAHRTYSGVEFIRDLIAAEGYEKAEMPIVLTSALCFAQQMTDRTTWKNNKVLANASLDYGASQTCQVALDHQLYEIDGRLKVVWDCADSIFPENVLEHMFQSFKSFLYFLAENLDWKDASSFNSLPASQAEMRRIVNNTVAPVTDFCLHDLFIRQAKKTPKKIAIKTDSLEIQYGTMDRWTNAIASQLLSLGAAPNTLIPVLMDKGWEQLIAVISILKAGAAYMPIDANLPVSRKLLLIKESGCRICLTQSDVEIKNLKNDLCALDEEIAFVPISLDCLESIPDSDDIPAKNKITDIAYVIFTSGSTGKPKGVVIDHRGAVNTILDINKKFDVNGNDKVLAISSLSFDLSVYDIFGILSVGGTVVIPSAEGRISVSDWCYYINKYNVTIWNTVPALMQLLVEHCEAMLIDVIENLKLVMMSGDWIPVSLPDRIKALASSSCNVISLGGATEASIWSIYHPITNTPPNLKSIPYGKPLANQCFFVLDKDMNECPDWVAGDLYIGGLGVAKGYWNDDEKTEKSFLTRSDGSIIYRTGDMGRYMDDGIIEFMGREDNQIKIQGYRVELGEIESVLNTHDDVEQSLVVAMSNANGKTLVAYVVENYDGDPVISLYQRNPNQQIIKKPADKKLHILARNTARKFNIEINATGLTKEYLLPYKSQLGDITHSSESSEYDVISNMFLNLRLVHAENKSIPEYLYPSASNLYSVQIFIYLSENVGKLDSGFYYFNNEKNSLVYLYNTNPFGECLNNNTLARCYWIADVENMLAIYPEELAHKLVFAEAGYMLAMLKERGTIFGKSLISSWALEKALPAAMTVAKGCYSLGYSDFLPADVEQKYCENINFSDKNVDNLTTIFLPRITSLPGQGPQYEDSNNTDSKICCLTELSAVLLKFNGFDIENYVYLKNNKIAGNNPSGWYRYQAESSCLIYLNTTIESSDIDSFFGTAKAGIYRDSAFTIVSVSRHQLNNRSRYYAAHVEAGCAVQNALTECGKYNLNIFPIGAIDEDKLRLMLNVDKSYFFVHGLIASKEASGNSLQDNPISYSDFNSVSDGVLKEFLASKLPSYMVPNIYVRLPSFPLTDTGKIDRKALPAPIVVDELNPDKRLPSTPTEIAIAEMWHSLLNIKNVGVNENIFLLGGNSLVVMKMVAKIKMEIGVDIKLPQLFESPTIYGISELVEKNKNKMILEDNLDIYSVKKSRENLVVPAGIANSYKDYVYPASFGQQALYTYEQLAKIKSAYNILLTFNLKGSLDLGLITKSVYALVNRHNLLRTQLKFSEDKLYQVEKDQYYPEIIRVTLNGDDNDSLEQQLNYTLAEYKAKPFNMLDDTLFSVLLITKNDNFHVLAFKLHHIILDYMSVEILRRDFVSLLQTNKLNMLSDLPALKLQYSDYVFWQKEFTTSTRADKQKDFWVKYLANSPALIFPDEEHQKESKSRVGVWRSYSLTTEKALALQNFSKKTDITMFMLVIAALHQVISYQCKQADLTIGTPISTRENPDLENIVGLMLNTLVMRIDSSKFETVGELLSSVQKNCISVFDNREIAYEEVLKHFRTHGIASKDLYRVRLVYRKIDANVEKVISDVEIDRFEMDRSEARFDLLVTLNDDGSVIDGELEYNASIWNSQRIDSIIEQFKEVLYLFSGSGEISLKEIQKRFQDIERKALTENIERSKAKKLSSLMSLAD